MIDRAKDGDATGSLVVVASTAGIEGAGQKLRTTERRRAP